MFAHTFASQFSVAGMKAAWFCRVTLAKLVVSDGFFKRGRGDPKRDDSCSLRISSCHGRVMRQTVAKTWMYVRHSSSVSPKFCGKDVFQEP